MRRRAFHPCGDCRVPVACGQCGRGAPAARCGAPAGGLRRRRMHHRLRSPARRRPGTDPPGTRRG
ncbi:hypothetical protein SBRY_140111 [Actinacidiphila bryophytorum]|uniref:Uncharacterized protein n=1 Tax=Actinacidiphila bryophytorum TaxID=1436133 RepID=A0A9W4GYK4_9ACTN|nr:hypothetical protein SBRY_140111 [Actinacidiphila bryophytorum]